MTILPVALPPQTMRGIAVTTPGGPEVLTLQHGLPCPAPGAQQALIAVDFAGVNRPDILQRKGLYPPPDGASPLLGLEVAGTIAALGPEVTGWAVGEPVCALLAGGGYAEYAVADAGCLLPVPDGLSLAAAAALPETVITVWANVFEAGRLHPGEILLVHGGSGGIGTTALQMGHLFGARVLATAGSASKCARIAAYGATAINYHAQDFVAATLAATEERGADVILDIVGGAYVQRNFAAAASGGRIVQIGLQGGATATMNLAPLLTKHLTLTGSTLRGRPLAEKARLVATVRQHVWPHIAAGRLRPVLDQIFPLADAAAAHRRMEAGEHFGKIVLAVRTTSAT